MKEHIGNTLQAVTVALLCWMGTTTQDVAKIVAVHEWRIAALEKH